LRVEVAPVPQNSRKELCGYSYLSFSPICHPQVPLRHQRLDRDGHVRSPPAEGQFLGGSVSVPEPKPKAAEVGGRAEVEVTNTSCVRRFSGPHGFLFSVCPPSLSIPNWQTSYAGLHSELRGIPATTVAGISTAARDRLTQGHSDAPGMEQNAQKTFGTEVSTSWPHTLHLTYF